MKIAILSDAFPTRSETFIVNQVIAFIDAGIDVTVLSVKPGDQTLFQQPHLAKYKLREKTIDLLPNEPKNSVTKWVTRLTFILKEYNALKLATLLQPEHYKTLFLPFLQAHCSKKRLAFDWVIAHFGHNGVLAQKLKLAGSLKQARIATVFHGADISSSLPGTVTGNLYKTTLHQTSLFLPISELWRQRLIALGLDDKKIFVQRMGVELQRFSFTPPQDKHKLTIFTAARFCQKKGLEFALEAVAEVKKHQQIEYILAGFGPLQAKLEEKVHKLGLQGVVKFIGPVSSSEVQQHLQSADIYLLPSVVADDGDMEGVPVALMEAMAAGVAVLSTFHSGIPELIEHRVHGLLAPEKDSASLASLLLELITNFALRQKLANNARARVEYMSDIEALNRQLITLLQDYDKYKQQF